MAGKDERGGATKRSGSVTGAVSRRLCRAASADDYLRAPFGKWWGGRTWIAFCDRERQVSGYTLFGQADEEDARAFIGINDLGTSPLAEPAPRYIDVRTLVVPAEPAFRIVIDYWAATAATLQRTVTRAAVVHGTGVTAAIAAGIDNTMPVLFPMRLFTDAREAWRWLTTDEDCTVVDEVDGLQAQIEDGQLVVGPEARWFRISAAPVVSLQRMHAPRLLLLALVRAHLAAPGRTLSAHALFAHGWPGQSVRPDAAAQRVYVAISTLRNLGLRRAIERHNDGYLLRADTRVRFEAGDT
jgi:hypothetical protein